MIALSDYLVLGGVMFCMSVAGIFVNRKNVIILLMCIELMLLSVNINFIAFSHFLLSDPNSVEWFQKRVHGKKVFRSVCSKTEVLRRDVIHRICID